MKSGFENKSTETLLHTAAQLQRTIFAGGQPETEGTIQREIAATIALPLREAVEAELLRRGVEVEPTRP